MASEENPFAPEYINIMDALSERSSAAVAMTPCPTCASPTLAIFERYEYKPKEPGTYSLAGVQNKVVIEHDMQIVVKCVAPDCDYEEVARRDDG